MKVAAALAVAALAARYGQNSSGHTEKTATVTARA